MFVEMIADGLAKVKRARSLTKAAVTVLIKNSEILLLSGDLNLHECEINLIQLK